MNCKNCQTELSEQDEYCRKCGGKVIRKRLSFRNLFEHLSETFFNYDNKLLRTFVQLFKKPEDVIVSYINGVRKKYVNPISFFGISLTLTGLSLFIIKKFYIEYLDFSSIYTNQASQEIFDSTSSSVMEYNSLFYFILIPFFALISWVVFLNKKYNFTEHIIIYLYTMSLITIVSVVISQLVLMIFPENYLIYTLLLYPLMFLYHCYVLKRIFQLSFGDLIIRSIIFIGIFFVLYIIITILVFAVIMLTGVLNIEDFKPK